MPRKVPKRKKIQARKRRAAAPQVKPRRSRDVALNAGLATILAHGLSLSAAAALGRKP